MPPELQNLSGPVGVIFSADTFVDGKLVEAPPRVPDCSGERFTEQPRNALCTGVLLSQHLFLTAGHCMRKVSITDAVVAFGYYYKTPGVLAVADGTLHGVTILSERLDPDSAETGLDYALLELSHPSLRDGVKVDVARPLSPGKPFTSIAASAGMPLKFDVESQVVEPRRASADSFFASSDTSEGASGSPLFDSDGYMMGILSRGQDDYLFGDSGCAQQRIVDSIPLEEYSSTSAIIEAICRDGAAAIELCPGSVGVSPEHQALVPESCSVLVGPDESPWSCPGMIATVTAVLSLRRKLKCRPRKL